MGANATGVASRVKSIPPSALKWEPALGRFQQVLSIPALSSIAAFLLLAALVAPTLWASGDDRRNRDLADAVSRLELIANLASYEITRISRHEALRSEHLRALVGALPPGALAEGRRLILADQHGGIVGTEPLSTGPARSLTDLFGEAHPLTDLADHPAVMAATLVDGSKVIANVRTVQNGHLALTQPMASVGRTGSGPHQGQTILALAAALGLGVLGAGWCWQAGRSRCSELAAERLQSRVDTSLAHGRCGLWDWDLARGRILWSASMYELLGYEPRQEHLSFGELNAIIHPKDGDLYALAQRVAASPAQPLDHLFRARTAGGAWLWLRVKAETVEDGSDGGRHLVGIAVDVTDELEAAHRNATADLRLRDAVEAISEAFVLFDEDHRLVLCNSRFQDLHGLPLEMMQPGATYAQIMQAGRAPKIERELCAAAVGREGGRTLELQLSDGRWLHINERRTRDGGFVSVGTDITALKCHEAKLLASEGRLLALVREAKQSKHAAQVQAQQLADLAERYHEQKDEAESASRAKTEFLAKMSHELRTPLNAIIGFAELMQEQIMGPLGCDKYREYVGDIRGSGMSLLDKIDDIMRLSRIEAGRFDLSPEPVDLRHVVEAAIAAVSRGADAKRLKLLSDVAVTPALEADSSALHQVLVQLLRNSVKFTREGGCVRVRVRPAGRAIHVFVEDDGIGIPRSFLSRLGTPFEQAETEYNRSETGCGLGLPLAKGLTELHDGRLRIRSQEGVGTVVLVRFPLERRTNREAVGAAQPFLMAAE